MDLQFLDGEMFNVGINQAGYGLDTYSGISGGPIETGATWLDLSGDSIGVYRGANDSGADYVRVRI